MITWSFSAHHTEKQWNADYNLFFKGLKFALKANYLANIEPRCYVNQISADSQQNLISLKHVSSWRKGRDKQRKGRDNLLAGKW